MLLTQVTLMLIRDTTKAMNKKGVPEMSPIAQTSGSASLQYGRNLEAALVPIVTPARPATHVMIPKIILRLQRKQTNVLMCRDAVVYHVPIQTNIILIYSLLIIR
jgi:hypothetical protein